MQIRDRSDVGTLGILLARALADPFLDLEGATTCQARPRP